MLLLSSLPRILSFDKAFAFAELPPRTLVFSQESRIRLLCNVWMTKSSGLSYQTLRRRMADIDCALTFILKHAQYALHGEWETRNWQASSENSLRSIVFTRKRNWDLLEIGRFRITFSAFFSWIFWYFLETVLKGCFWIIVGTCFVHFGRFVDGLLKFCFDLSGQKLLFLFTNEPENNFII